MIYLLQDLCICTRNPETDFTPENVKGAPCRQALGEKFGSPKHPAATSTSQRHDISSRGPSRLERRPERELKRIETDRLHKDPVETDAQQALDFVRQRMRSVGNHPLP
jgi:hypothetical protein